MMIKTYARPMLFTTLALATLISLSGCSPGKDKQEPVTQEAPITLESETQTVAATETEVQTEPEKTLKDIQVSIPKTGRAGQMTAQVVTGQGEEDATYSFQATADAFLLSGDDGTQVYSDSAGTYFYNASEWKSNGAAYASIWDFSYSDACVKMDDAEINGTACYHLALESDDEAGFLNGVCGLFGYENAMNGSVDYDFYVSKETSEIVRVDLSMPFMGDMDGKDEKGTLFASLATAQSADIEITAPDIQVAETEEEEASYVAGTILPDQGLYQNDTFGIKLLAGDLFTFDSARTAELDANYKEAGSQYMEEAYGEGNGVIVNISSIAAEGMSKKQALDKYLADSGAEGTENAKKVTVGENSYRCQTATINATSTKTYCTVYNGRALLITVYFTDSSVVGRFEDAMYALDENPYWSEDEWVLEGKYRAVTPKGYSIIKGESGDLFVCMKDSQDEVNVFCISDSSIETEAEKESVPTGDVNRETIAREEIPAADGTMTYLEVLNTDAGFTYYTYAGLVQEGPDVIKVYAVSTAETDYREIFTEFADNIKPVDMAGEGLAEGETQAETAIQQ